MNKNSSQTSGPTHFIKLYTVMREKNNKFRIASVQQQLLTLYVCNNIITSNQDAVNYMLGFISNSLIHYLLR